jgi:hypothetical protein
MRLRHHSLLLLLPVLTAPLIAERIQAPDAPWRTLRTAHYRIHYPERGGFEPFALEVASKIEGIHAKVTEWVGYESPQVIEVVIKDPLREANGFALPLLRHPHVVLWPTPPEADSGIAHVTTWAELLVTHELTHVHHLMRPQNRPNLGDRLLDMPVGPISRKAPRWVNEGYATVIEGKITGKGRPHSAYRAATLRQWALEGKLPDYGRISGMDGFRGGSMAYLIGSAYLEWLEARTPDPEILKKFWKQLTSKRRNSFDASFKATFGIAARDGYDRWRAEITRDALELERLAKAAGWLHEGAVFTKIEGEVTDLAVSPDGKKLLARVVTKHFRGLRIWDLLEKDPHLKSLPEKTPDPEEVQEAKPSIPDRKAKWSLGRVNNAIPRRAAWDRDRVLFELRTPDSEGVLQASVWSWKPGSSTPLRQAGTRELSTPAGLVQEQSGLWTILNNGKPVVRTLSAAWNPTTTADGQLLFYTQLAATGIEIRRLELNPPAVDQALPQDPAPLTRSAVVRPADAPNTLPAPTVPPKPAPYDAWGGLWQGARVAAGIAPSGLAYQVGYGGADLLGRASWHLLAGVGDAAGPRGAALGLAWRGWRWAPALEVFSSLEKPSRQDWIQPLGLDRQRRGAELSFAFEDRGAWPTLVRPALALERISWLDANRAGGDRRAATVEAEVRRGWRPNESWLFEGLAWGRQQWARTLDQNWSLQRGAFRFRVVPPEALPPISIEAEAGRLGGNPNLQMDSFYLGGLGTSLVPSSLDASRVVQTALPSHILRGDRFQRGRVQVGQGFRAYWEAAVVWDRTQPRPACQRVAGLELALDELVSMELSAPLLGRMTYLVGVHQILQDGPQGQKLKGKVVGTLSIILRP